MELLYSDFHTVVCIKPVGMDSEHDVPEALKAQLGGDIFPIHRLDLNVAGVMVFARTKKAAAELSAMVQNGSLIKEYVALVHGTPPESGDWEDLLFKDSRQNKVFTVKRERKGVKKARLEFRRLTAGAQSCVRIRLHTGRSHQIRVQFSSRGYPLVGDHKYGARDGVDAPMLFSCCLTFPWRGEIRRFEAMPPWTEPTIRPAGFSDLPRLLEVYAAARDFMCRAGNPTQWPEGYPGEAVLAEDIALERLYAVEDLHGKLWGCFMLAAGPDATYARIFDGAWSCDTPYGVLHRVASDGSHPGLMNRCVAFAAQRFSHLRIDTHEKNLPMQRALTREGFIHRGTVITDDGTPRLAYDRITE